MKSYMPEINDEGSFAKDVMPPLGQNIRASIGSYSMSKHNQNVIMTPNDGTAGKSGGQDSVYAPSINMKSIMKQSVFSPSEGQRPIRILNEEKKVQIMESREFKFKSNRDSAL